LIAGINELAGRPIIIGGGAAGVATALALAPEPVVLLSKAPLGEAAFSAWVQGGLAASLGEDDDPQLHFEDTIAADGFARWKSSGRSSKRRRRRLRRLLLSASPYRAADGSFRLGLEAAHQRLRIVHAGGDGTGRELMRALVAAALRTPSITVLASFEARRLLVEDNAIVGDQLPLSGPGGMLV
jgi:L-aspartate oxidase